MTTEDAATLATEAEVLSESIECNGTIVNLSDTLALKLTAKEINDHSKFTLGPVESVAPSETVLRGTRPDGRTSGSAP